MPTTDFYDDPAIYDILHAPGTAAEVDGLERIALRFAPGPPERHVWLDPACGTARYLRVAASRGRPVIGVDLNPAMIDYARRRLPNATLLHGDMQHIDDLIRSSSVHFGFNTINTIRHLPTDDAVARHLRAMSRVLAPGGVYAVGLSLSDYDNEMPTEDVWEGARGRCRVRQIVQYEPPNARARRERVISHLTIERPRGEEHVDSTYDLRAYSERQWRRLIERSPLRLAATVDEHARDIEPAPMGYAIWVLQSM